MPRRISLIPVLFFAATAAFPQVSLTTLGVPSTQGFDNPPTAMPTSGSATWTNDTTVPGWYHARTGTGTTVVANNGSSNAGNLYSYGTGTNADRALGSVGSGNAAVGNLFWGVRLANNTGATITALDVSYVGEQWRNSAAAAQTVTFSYLVGSPTVTGSLAEFQSAGVAVPALDLTSPITGGTAGALDGNLAANRVAKTFLIGGLSIPNGTEVMLRWADPDHTGADHGLAIDDFSVTPQGAPPLPTLNVGDVSAVEGAAGTQVFAFAVTLTAPAPPGGVTFDVATADDTATTADNDYVGNSLTGQTIPAGSTGPYIFNVTVNGDNDSEPTETFFVDVTNVTGATPGDTQGTGTIQTDDAPPDLTIDDVTQVETNAGTTTFTFTVSLSAPPVAPVVFDVATAPGTATAGSDYVHQALTGQTINPGNTTYMFDVTVNGDTLFAANETFFVDVTNVLGANVVDGQGLGTIENDDPQPSFAIADAAVTEGNAGTTLLTFTVTMTGAAEGTATVDWATSDGVATVGTADYVGDSAMLTFVSGDSAEQLDVTVNGDTDLEGDEHFNVTLSSPTVATIADGTAFGVIKNDDPIGINAVDTPFFESFDSLLPSTAPSTPPGWTFVETDTNANLTYTPGTGSSSAGDTYNFGVNVGDPDRAFGGLQSGSLLPTIGAFYRNDTGVTITSLAIVYHGEQWRLGTAGRTDRLDFQYSIDATDLATGTWTNVDELDFLTPSTTGTGAKNGNDPANRRQVVYNVTGLSIAPGGTFRIRFTDFNASGADDGLAVDDFSINANFAGALLSIDDVSTFEGDAGTTSFTFTVSLSQPAPPGGVTFDVATMDGSATTADNDYVALALAGETIAAGDTSKQYDVTVNGDVSPEVTEEFFVNVTNVTGALPQDPQGVGTIIDDDTPLTLIHDVQGPGGSSPIVGTNVTVRGIVTGVKSNGFFVQEEEADYDLDSDTSEGVFVFTSGAPPAAAAFAAQVQVTGTVAEFVPSADPQQPPLTELTSPTVVQLATGQPLPAAVPLTATFPDPAGPFDQLERVEGMRVSVASLTVTGPSDGSFFETTGAGTSNGRFFGVVTGLPRPFREAGIQQPDVAPTGTIPPIPRWDFNPERLKVESATINGQPVLTVKSSDVLGPIVGPLDYGFRAYAIYPDGTNAVTVTPGTLPTTVTAPLAHEITVASFNLQRLFDDVDDPGGDPLVSGAAYDDRLGKASIAIRDHLFAPDVIGVQEVEKLGVLEDLAARILADGGPEYDAFLVEGNDVGGIDVGFLVKVEEVALGLPRVDNVVVTQEGGATTWTDPSTGAPALLNDRPPLVLEATVHRALGASFDVTVINNHLRSLNGIDSSAPAGLTTEGDRVRQKRLAQATFLANLVQTRQTLDPTENIILVGDFNAFEVNDGYADVIGTILGTPVPDDETVVPGDGVDLVNPDLDDLVDTPPAAERYSYVHEGNAQNLDHAIVNAALVAATSARRIEHPRIDADHPETERNTPTTALRISDHDPLLVYLAVPTLVVADLAVDVQHATGYATAGAATSYTVVVTNNGPDVADGSLSLALPAEMLFASVTPPAGWTCPTQPAVGTSGTIVCDAAVAAPGTHTFTVDVTADASAPPSTVTTANGTVSTTATDSAAGNDTDAQDVTILQPAQYRAEKTVSGTFLTGSDVTYTITIFNDKPFTQDDNAGDELTDVLPASLTLVSATATSGTAVATVATNTVTWNGSIAAGGTVTITIVATIDAGAAGTIANQASLDDDFDDDGTNERATSSDDPSVGGDADPTSFGVIQAGEVTATKSVSGTFVQGTDVTYTIVITNGMAIAQPNNFQHEFTDNLPAGLTFVSAAATSGTTGFCCGSIFFWDGSIPAGGTVTVTIVATIDPTATGTISNQGQTIFDTDDDNSNDSSHLTDDPSTAAVDDPTSFTVVSSDALAATKTASTTAVLGGPVTYTITITNELAHTLTDNPGDEFVDVLPAELSLDGASATSGTTTIEPLTGTVRWNGSLASGASVTITIEATIESIGTISNQAQVFVDLDDDGTNETTVETQAPGGGPTTFVVSGGAIAEIPTLSPTMLVALMAIFGALALRRLRRPGSPGR